jgi:hypothetical protein
MLASIVRGAAPCSQHKLALACVVAAQAKGDLEVNLGSIRSGASAALAMTLALAGCSNLDTTEAWFRKPVDMFGRSGGYTFADVGESRRSRPIAANDLVAANGTCAPLAAPPQAPLANAGQGASPAASPGTDGLIDEGIALGMSECDVVYRAGQPSGVQLGSNPNGDRTAILTYSGGPRPGIYHFERGELMQMDRVAEPPPPPEAPKKKAAKIKKPPKKSDQS